MRSGSAASASRSRTCGGRTTTGPIHILTLRQVTVADEALVAVRGLQIGMLAEKVHDLGLDCLGQQGTRPRYARFR